MEADVFKIIIKKINEIDSKLLTSTILNLRTSLFINE